MNVCRVYNEGEVVFISPGDNQLLECLYNALVYGCDFVPIDATRKGQAIKNKKILSSPVS